MKKYFFSAAALLLIAGISNAQVDQKQPAKATSLKQASMTTKPSNVSKSGSSVSKSVTPTKTSSPAQSTNTAIKRKHHKKSTPKKTGTK